MLPTNVFVLAGLTMGFWALWVLFTDQALESLSATQVGLLYFVSGTVVMGTYALVTDASLPTDSTGVGYAVLAAVFSAVGIIFYYSALETGNTGIATTIAGLYFVPVALVGVLLLGDSLSPTNAMGIGAAAVAIFLLLQ